MKQKTAREMRPLLEAYARYGGSKKAFCREHGIGVHVLDYWRRKLPGSHAEGSSFISLEVDRLSLGGSSIELRYPSGLRAIVPLDTPAAVWQHLLQFDI
jgi:hypothetical protein